MSEGLTEVIVMSPEDKLAEARELERLIREDEDLLQAQRAAATGTGRRIAELTIKLRQLLRDDARVLPLFNDDSPSSTDGPDEAA